MITEPERYRFTVDEYLRMAEVGILSEDSPVELVHGEIIRMSPEGPRHTGLVIRLTRLLDRRLGDRVSLWSQGTIRLGAAEAPEPDLVLLRPRPDDYVSRLPTAEDTLLVVEVAGTTLKHDRQVKAALYAEHGIPEYWIVDISSVPSTIVVYQDPGANGYQTVRPVRHGEPLSPLAFPEVVLDTESLLA